MPEDRFDLQPLIPPDGDSVFVSQCRLDNREDLAAELQIAEQGVADSTLLHEAFLRWGHRCVEHMYGDFAFAVYSRKKRSLFAATDALGQYRLFYAAQPGRITLSTQLAALSTAAWLTLNADDVALGMLGAGQLRPGSTAWREVRLLPGGHTLLWQDGHLETRRWWRPETGPSLQFGRMEEYVDFAGALLQQAVKSCLRSATPVSATLSGGLDSGLVTSIAARTLGERALELPAYTAAVDPQNPSLRRPGWDPDDAPFAQATAAMHPNVRHTILRTDDRVALDLFAEVRERSATVLRNGANHVWLDAIARLARSAGSRVLLTGARGNFGISYNGNGAVVELFRQMKWGAALRLANEMESAGERAAWKSVGGAAMPQRIFDWARWKVCGRSQAERGERDFLTPEFRSLHQSELQQDLPPSRTRATFTRRATIPAHGWAADALPQWDVEMRDPTSDRRLVEGLLAMPLYAFLPEGRSRGLARRLGTGLLPENVRLRRSQGQQSPDYAAVMRRGASRYKDAVRHVSTSEICRQTFDMGALRDGVDAVGGGSQAAYLTSGIDRVLGASLFMTEAAGGSQAGKA